MMKKLACAIQLLAAPASAQDGGDLMTLYRDFHANPELSMQEVRSAGIMAREARKAGFTVTEKVGKTGVVAVLLNGPGPTLMIRADMARKWVRSRQSMRSSLRMRIAASCARSVGWIASRLASSRSTRRAMRRNSA